MCVSAQLCSVLCSPVDCILPGPSKNTGLPFLTQGDLPDPRIKASTLALSGTCFTIVPPGKPRVEIFLAFKPWQALRIRDISLSSLSME